MGNQFAVSIKSMSIGICNHTGLRMTRITLNSLNVPSATSVGHPFPAMCVRTSTERPEAMEKGCFILAGIDGDGLLQAVDAAVELVQNGDNGIPVPDYVDENVSDKVVKIIQYYTGVVNKMVWRKY